MISYEFSCFVRKIFLAVFQLYADLPLLCFCYMLTGHVNPNDCIFYELLFLALFMQYGYRLICLSFKGICVNQKDMGKCNSSCSFILLYLVQKSAKIHCRELSRWD